MKAELEQRIYTLWSQKELKNDEVTNAIISFGQEQRMNISTHVPLYEDPQAMFLEEGRSGISVTKDGIIAWTEPGETWIAYAPPQELTKIDTYRQLLGSQELGRRIQEIRNNYGDTPIRYMFQRMMRHLHRGVQ